MASVFNGAGSGPYKALGDASLLDGLAFQGGTSLKGAAEILLRAAISAVLNAAHPDVNYPRTVGEIVTSVNDALDSHDRSTILSLASALNADNNLFCPLGGSLPL